MYWYGVEGDFKAIVMEMLGPDLHKLFEFCEQKFKPTTIAWLGIQMIQRIESVHSKEIIHRDIKPENFLIGTSKKVNTVYQIDFGLSKRFINPITGEHVEKKKTSWVTGTPRYCSKNAWMGKP